jgi:hypothetical protein
VVQNDAEREDVAPRIVADASDLFRGNVRAGPDRKAELLGKEIRQPIVSRDPEVDDHGLTAFPEHHVARLDVEVDDVLAVDVVQGGRHAGADRGNLGIGEGHPVQLGAQRVAVDPLHDDEWLRRETPRRHVAGRVVPGQRRQNHHFHLEGHDRRRVFRFPESRDFHHEGRRPAAWSRHPPDARHAPVVDPFVQSIPVDHGARLKSVTRRCGQSPASSRLARLVGSPDSRILRATLV